jgi:RimJ/RimL family protein N-acetyltransferase
MYPVFETKRLTLYPLTLDDAPATQRLFPHWDVVRFLGNKVPWPYPDDGALRFYRDALLPAVERGDQWAWSIWLNDGPEHHIGVINLSRTGEENRGFWLGLPWHGKGLMTEASEAVTEFWFNGLGQQKLRMAKACENIASRRICERQGARLVDTHVRNFVCGPALAEIWEQTREEWNARRRGAADAAGPKRMGESSSALGL